MKNSSKFKDFINLLKYIVYFGILVCVFSCGVVLAQPSSTNQDTPQTQNADTNCKDTFPISHYTTTQLQDMSIKKGYKVIVLQRHH